LLHEYFTKELGASGFIIRVYGSSTLPGDSSGGDKKSGDVDVALIISSEKKEKFEALDFKSLEFDSYKVGNVFRMKHASQCEVDLNCCFVPQEYLQRILNFFRDKEKRYPFMDALVRHKVTDLSRNTTFSRLFRALLFWYQLSEIFHRCKDLKLGALLEQVKFFAKQNYIYKTYEGFFGGIGYTILLLYFLKHLRRGREEEDILTLQAGEIEARYLSLESFIDFYNQELQKEKFAIRVSETGSIIEKSFMVAFEDVDLAFNVNEVLKKRFADAFKCRTPDPPRVDCFKVVMVLDWAPNNKFEEENRVLYYLTRHLLKYSIDFYVLSSTLPVVVGISEATITTRLLDFLLLLNGLVTKVSVLTELELRYTWLRREDVGV